MHVQMKYNLATMPVAIDHQSIAVVGNTRVFRDFLRDQYHVSDQFSLTGFDIVSRRDRCLGRTVAANSTAGLVAAE